MSSFTAELRVNLYGLFEDVLDNDQLLTASYETGLNLAT